MQNILKIRLSLTLFLLNVVVFSLFIFLPAQVQSKLSELSSWPSLLTNSFFIVLIIEVYFRKSSRWFLLLPVIWFGSFLLMSALSNYEYEILRNKINALNVEKHFDFDEERDSLIGTEKDVLMRVEDRIIENYKIKTVYAIDKSYEQGYRALELGDSLKCKPRNLIDNDKYTFYRNVLNKSIKGSCVTAYGKQPIGRKVFIYSKIFTYEQRFLIKSVITETKIYDDFGKSINLYNGFAMTVNWFPKITLYCKNEGCFYDFIHSSRKFDENNLDYQLAAKALGLKEYPSSDDKNFNN